MIKLLKRFSFSASTTIDKRMKPRKIVGNRFEPRLIVENFGISTVPEDSDETIKQKYMDFWARPSPSIKWKSIYDVLEDEKKYKFIEFTKL